MRKGKFITIDGPDGSGKSTLLKRLQEIMESHNVRAIFTREPGGSPYGERIRELILSDAGAGANALTMLYLFNAARADHIASTILPALQDGVHVISDRFDAVTFAYQIIAEERHDLMPLFEAMRARYVQDLNPFYICLDVSPDIGRQRLEGRAEKLNHFDARSLEWHRRARQGFQTFLHRFVPAHQQDCILAERSAGEVLAYATGKIFEFLRY